MRGEEPRNQKLAHAKEVQSSQAPGEEVRSQKSFEARGEEVRSQKCFEARGEEVRSQKSSEAHGEEVRSQKSSEAHGEEVCSQKSSEARGEEVRSQKSSEAHEKEVFEKNEWSRSKAIKEFFRAHEGISAENATTIRGFDRLDHSPPGTPTAEEAIVQKMASLQVQGPSVSGPGQKRSAAASGTPAAAHAAKKPRYVELQHLPEAGDFIVCQGKTLQVTISEGTCVLQPYEAGYLN